MKFTRSLSCCLVMGVFILSCQKAPTVSSSGNTPPTDTTTTTTPGPPPPKLHMSLSYLLMQSTLSGTSRTNYELLVSESGGKVLFDSVSSYNQTVTADLLTSATLVDVSVIYSASPLGGTPQFFAYTYKSVNLANWTNVPLSDSVPGTVNPVVTGTATMQLMNVAAPTPFYWQFMSNTNPGVATSPEGVSYTSSLSVSYPYENDEYAYLAFPYDGLYKLHKIQGMNDSVDLSQLDTAKTVSFNWPAQYDINILLYGYMDSTNLSKSLLLAPGHGDYTHAYSFETMYPANSLFQKYDLVLTGNLDPPSTTLPMQAGARLTNLDTIPLNIPFPDQSYFIVNSSTPDSFSITFPKGKPTYYTFSSSFGAGNNFLLTVAGDSTVLDPERMLALLVQGKLLKGIGPAMFVNGFELAIDANNPDYQSYMKKEGNVTTANQRPLSDQVTLSVYLGAAGGPEVTKFFRLSPVPGRR